jgi:hypothetical protein
MNGMVEGWEKKKTNSDHNEPTNNMCIVDNPFALSGLRLSGLVLGLLLASLPADRQLFSFTSVKTGAVFIV